MKDTIRANDLDPLHFIAEIMIVLHYNFTGML